MSASRRWSAVAALLGLGHAAVSLLWVLGSTWFIDTVGGSIERWGRDGGPGVRLALLAVVGAKLAAVVVAWLAVTRPSRLLRTLAWLAGGMLTLYGGVLTVVGIGYVNLAPLDDVADPYALRWHAYFWDPWFLLWGVAILAALATSRPRPDDATPRTRGRARQASVSGRRAR